MFDNIVVETIS